MTKENLINGMTTEEFLKKQEQRSYIVQVRLINQDGEEEWGDYARKWKNEDVAISHLNLLGTLLEESSKKGDGKEHERIFEKLSKHLISPYAKTHGYRNINKTEGEK